MGATPSISVENWTAERIVGPHPNAIAIELDLTGVIVEAWRRQQRNAELCNFNGTVRPPA